MPLALSPGARNSRTGNTGHLGHVALNNEVLAVQRWAPTGFGTGGH